MTITYDLYKILGLDRSWDEKQIRTELKNLTKLWTGRENACNDKEQAMRIDEMKKLIEEAFKNLTKTSKRKKYDEALDKAYKNGTIADEKEKEMIDLLEQAKEYYKKGNIKLATQYAKEAIEGQVNDVQAYDLLARCYYDTSNYEQALNTIDRGLDIFNNNENLQWLGVRISIVGTKDYEVAQNRINIMMESHPNSMLAYTEQINLYLYKGEEQIAFDEIDKYILNNPDDMYFKKNIAYTLDSFSNNYYYVDNENAMYIADKESYKKCVQICTKAYDLFQDEHTQAKLESAKFYGKKEWDSWNINSIKTLSLYGAILLIIPPVGLFFLAIDILLIYFSFRPYWQINKTYVTGQRGGLESIVSTLGSYMAEFSYQCFRGVIWLIQAFIKFILWLVSGMGL